MRGYLCHAVSLSGFHPTLLSPCSFFCKGNIWLDRPPAGLRIVWIFRPIIHALDTRHAVNNSLLCMSYASLFPFIGAFVMHSDLIHFLCFGGSSHCTVKQILFLIDSPSSPWCFVLLLVLPVPLTTPDQATNYSCWHEPPYNLKSTSLSLFLSLPLVISFITFHSAFILLSFTSSSSSLMPLYLNLLFTTSITHTHCVSNSHNDSVNFLYEWHGGLWVEIPFWTLVMCGRFFLCVWAYIPLWLIGSWLELRDIWHDVLEWRDNEQAYGDMKINTQQEV